jgi:hypothetical protein
MSDVLRAAQSVARSFGDKATARVFAGALFRQERRLLAEPATAHDLEVVDRQDGEPIRAEVARRQNAA